MSDTNVLSGAFVDQTRLQMPSRWVRATNTDAVQMHTIIDKAMTGHEMKPGQSVEFEMTEQDFERFEELSAKGHPVKIVSMPRQRGVPTKPPTGGGAAGASGASGSEK